MSAAIKIGWWLTRAQLATMLEGETGEEGDYFRKLLREDLPARIAAVPPLYSQDSLGDAAQAHLH